MDGVDGGVGVLCENAVFGNETAQSSVEHRLARPCQGAHVNLAYAMGQFSWQVLPDRYGLTAVSVDASVNDALAIAPDHLPDFVVREPVSRLQIHYGVSSPRFRSGSTEYMAIVGWSSKTGVTAPNPAK